MRTRIWWSKYLDGGRRGRLATCPRRCAVECVEEDEDIGLPFLFFFLTNRYGGVGPTLVTAGLLVGYGCWVAVR
jgi:hypothetical protein